MLDWGRFCQGSSHFSASNKGSGPSLSGNYSHDGDGSSGFCKLANGCQRRIL